MVCKFGKRLAQLAILAVVALVWQPGAQCQLNSTASSVLLTGTLVEALTVVAAPSAAIFNLSAGGTANAVTPVVVTTTWVLGGGRTNVKVYGHFASSTAAMTDGSSDNIASANILGQVTTGTPTTLTAFTQTGPFGAAGASLLLFTQPITLLNSASLRIDTLNLQVDLTGIQIPSGIYTGTLWIQAQAL